jgi:hydroxymethylpyrimidine kinase / phosphomethylpyrimidine kinase / thiamine-phosphate diphosphorylase
MNTPPTIVWTIAGSDSGGGAGIQADLATAQDLGCHCATVITTVTAQNSVCVSLVEGVSAAMLLAQLNSLARDLPPAAIKIGLLASQQQVDVVANWLKRLTQQRRSKGQLAVILDPVMVASSGDRLNLNPSISSSMSSGMNSGMSSGTGSGFNSGSGLDFSAFIGVVSLITPNQQELQHLVSGQQLSKTDNSHDSRSQGLSTSIESQADFIAKTEMLAHTFGCHVLAKGGDGKHWQGDAAIDCYVCHHVEGASLHHDNATYLLSSCRVNTGNSHGTGCTLSMAIASFMAQDFVLHDAIVLAKAYVTQGLIESYQPGSGPGTLARTGWPDDLALFPQIWPVNDADINGSMKANSDSIEPPLPNLGQCISLHSKGFKPIEKDLGIYPVVDSLALLKTLLKAGCRTIQLRLKIDSKEAFWLKNQHLEQQVIDAIELGRTFNAQVFINDHWQLALRHKAFGVHLGQEDLFEVDLKAIKAAGMALGLSSHSYFEILLSHQLRPSYIALGHIFPTPTKTMASKPQGLKKLKHYAKLLNKHYPTVAIGGIDKTRLKEIKATGVANVAVVRALTNATDPTLAFDNLTRLWNGNKAEQYNAKLELEHKKGHMQASVTEVSYAP